MHPASSATASSVMAPTSARCPRSRERLQAAHAVFLHIHHKAALASSCSNWASASRRAIFSACGSRRFPRRGTADPAARPHHAPCATPDMAEEALAAQQRPLRPLRAASYSAKISNLYLAVNVRRFALSGTSGSRRSVPASSTRPGSTTRRPKQYGHLASHSGISPSPPSVTNCQPAVASDEAGREGLAVFVSKRHQRSRRWGTRKVACASPDNLGLITLCGTVIAPRPFRPWKVTPHADGEERRRAVCGKTACTGRRGGAGNGAQATAPAPHPTPE